MLGLLKFQACLRLTSHNKWYYQLYFLKWLIYRHKLWHHRYLSSIASQWMRIWCKVSLPPHSSHIQALFNIFCILVSVIWMCKLNTIHVRDLICQIRVSQYLAIHQNTLIVKIFILYLQLMDLFRWIDSSVAWEILTHWKPGSYWNVSFTTRPALH